MSRFQYGGVFLLIFIAYLALAGGYRKVDWKRFGLGIVAAIVVASPWLLFNYQSFGDPVGGPAHQATGDLGFDPRAAVMYFPYALVVMGFAAPFVLLGAYRSFKSRILVKKNMFLFLALVGVFVVQFVVFGKVAEERYLLPMLPAAAVLGGLGLASVSKKRAKIASYVFVALVSIGLIAGAYGALYLKDYPRYNETKDAVEFLKENCPSPVMGNSFTQVWYYADYVNVPLLQDRAGIESAKSRGVECVLVSLYETPFRNDLAGSGLVEKAFQSGKVSVYRIL
jgi:4-amino-4-deoxy-L-arabinose transferase-like glycosyltransferase